MCSRPTDCVALSNRGAQTAAVYDIQDVARIHVWSTGGFISNIDEPMIHVGIQIENISRHAIGFDSTSFELVVFHECGAPMPDPMLTSNVPLGPSHVLIPSATGVTLDLYFKLAVRLQLVASMRARWSILAAEERLVRSTSFVRNDDRPDLRPRPADSAVRLAR